MNGADAKPENRAGLYVFHPEPPLAPGDTMTRRLDVRRAQEPMGISKNGAGNMEFILPSSAVLTGFDSANLAPQLGWLPDVGIREDKNKADPREYRRRLLRGQHARRPADGRELVQHAHHASTRRPTCRSTPPAR